MNNSLEIFASHTEVCNFKHDHVNPMPNFEKINIFNNSFDNSIEDPICVHSIQKHTLLQVGPFKYTSHSRSSERHY